MAKRQIQPWDAATYLETQEDVVLYLDAAFEDGDPGLIAAALGDVARAKGMMKVAAEAGLGRESLYKALSPDGNPEFATVLKVTRALGLRLHASASTAGYRSRVESAGTAEGRDGARVPVLTIVHTCTISGAWTERNSLNVSTATPRRWGSRVTLIPDAVRGVMGVFIWAPVLQPSRARRSGRAFGPRC